MELRNADLGPFPLSSDLVRGVVWNAVGPGWHQSPAWLDPRCDGGAAEADVSIG
jgi:hypothetical protein